MSKLSALRDLKLTRTVGSATLTAVLAPHCCLHASSSLEVEVSLGQQTGYLFKQQFVDTVTESDVQALLDSVGVIPCVACKAPALDVASISTNRHGLCGACVLAMGEDDYRAYVLAEKQKLEAVIDGLKADGKARGFTHLVEAVIHPKDDEPYPHLFFVISDCAAAIELKIGSMGSHVASDYRVEAL